jgi:hypothetical protein
VNFALFRALFRSIAPDHQPEAGLKEAVQDILDGLAGMGFNDPNYLASDFVRFNVLEAAIEQGWLRPGLRWADLDPGRSARLPAALRACSSDDFDFEWIDPGPEVSAIKYKMQLPSGDNDIS